MKDYKPTMFIVEMVTGKQLKFDDDRFRIEISEDRDILRVYNRITGLVDAECNMDKVLYLRYNIVKRPRKNHESQEEPFNSPEVPDDISVEDAE